MTVHAGDNPLAGVDTPTIINQTLTLANTEETVNLPVNTRKFSIKPRTASHIIKLSYTEGESGTKYLTIPSGGHWEDFIGVPNLNLYLQSATAGAIAEIVAWK